MSIHTASRIILLTGVPSDGGIAHLKHVHRTTNTSRCQNHGRISDRTRRTKQKSSSESTMVGSNDVSIAAASFMGGYKARIVTVGADGKCRMIDFERGASLLRTWHLPAACTALAIYSPPPLEDGHHQQPGLYGSGESTQHQSGHVIAVGRADGAVSLFDNLGLLREDKRFSEIEQPIIDLDWVTNHRSSTDEAGGMAQPIVEDSLRTAEWKFALSPQESSPINTRPVSFPVVDRIQVDAATQTEEPDMSDDSFDIAHTVSHRPLTPITPPQRTAIAKAGGSGSPQKSSQSSPHTPCSSPSPRLLDALRRTPFKSSPLLSQNLSMGVASDDEKKEVRSPALSTIFSRMPCSWDSNSSFDSNEENPLFELVEDQRCARPDRCDSAMPTQTDVTTSMAKSNDGKSMRGLISSRTASPSPRPRQPSPRYHSDDWETDNGTSPEVAIPQRKQVKLRRMTHHENLPLFPQSMRTFESPPAHRLGVVSYAGTKIPSSAGFSGNVKEGPINRHQASTQSHASSSSHKPLPLPPGDRKELPNDPPELGTVDPNCDCDCADLIRDDFSLVRVEIASLRKAIWVLGSRIDGKSGFWRD